MVGVGRPSQWGGCFDGVVGSAVADKNVGRGEHETQAIKWWKAWSWSRHVAVALSAVLVKKEGCLV